MYADNIFFVSDDPYLTSENFYNNMIYKNKKIIPFDTTWLAIENDIKLKNKKYSFYEQYAYDSKTEGYINEYNLVGILNDIDVNSSSINGYELHSDGYYFISNNIFLINNQSTDSKIIIPIYLRYEWGIVELKHIIYFDGIRPASSIFVTIKRSKIFYPKSQIKNKLIDYFSKYSETYNYKYEIEPSVINIDATPTSSASIDYFNNNSLYTNDSIKLGSLKYRDFTYIKEIHDNDVYDYEYDPIPGVFIDLNTGYVSINPSLINNNVIQYIKIYTVSAIYEINIKINLLGDKGFDIIEYNNYMKILNQDIVDEINEFSLTEINELLSLILNLNTSHFTYSANQLNIILKIVNKSIDILQLDNTLSVTEALNAAISVGDYSEIILMSEFELNDLLNIMSDDVVMYTSPVDYLVEMKNAVDKMLIALNTTEVIEEAFDIAYNNSIDVIIDVNYTKRLDDSIFIDSLDMLKSSAMKMLTYSSKYFEASKIPITKQMIETYNKGVCFGCNLALQVEGVDTSIKTTTLQLCSVELLGEVTKHLEFSDEKRTFFGNFKSTIIFDNRTKLLGEINNLLDIVYPIHYTKLTMSNNLILTTTMIDKSIILSNKLLPDNILYDDSSYSYYYINDSINFNNDVVIYQLGTVNSSINMHLKYESDIYFDDNTDIIHTINESNINIGDNLLGYNNIYTNNKTLIIFDNMINMSITQSKGLFYYYINDTYEINNSILKVNEIVNGNDYIFNTINSDITLLSNHNSKTNAEKHYFNGSHVISRPIIGNIPTKTFESDIFDWSYIALSHTLTGKYYTSDIQMGALQQLDGWLFPIQWIFNQIIINNENIQPAFINTESMNNQNIKYLMQNLSLDIITKDQLLKFRLEFEDKFMNNSHGQVDNRKYNSMLIDNQYGLLNFITNHFYTWVWQVLWKYWNKHNTFYNFVDAVIKFGVPIIIESYYAYDYEGDGLERFNMYVISEVSRYIKSKFINEMNQEEHKYRNIFIYNSYFKRKTLETNHNFWGKQFSRISNMYFVKLYNELIIDQYRVRVNKDIYDSGWVNYFMNFYDNYDYDVYIPYKDNVVLHDVSYINNKHTQYNYLFRDTIYPTTKGIEFEFILPKAAVVDACYIFENRHNNTSNITHYNNKFIPVGKSHDESIHIMQNKIWFKYYTQINDAVINKINYALNEHSIESIGYIMTENLSINDYINIDKLPKSADVFINLDSMQLSVNDDLNYVETFFNYETNPMYKRFDKLNAIIKIDKLPINPLDQYILLLKKYIHNFMIVIKIRNGVVANKKSLTTDVQQALNVFGHRLIIYIDCVDEADYLIGRIIGTRLMNTFNNINIAIDLIDHISFNNYNQLIDFNYSNRLQDSADLNIITLYNNDVQVYIDIYKFIVDDKLMYIKGSIDSNVLDADNNSSGYGDVKVNAIMDVYEIEQTDSLIFIDGHIETTLINSINIKISKI